ncbi:MAG: undecaprenyldiphospho-muramoylpentapeptide beta-N-acetylglucosaminyltransferase [Treponema sp.]|nr:undecaprenyldiphospho-muramoylpentapeptide beta-N-acetylglucosaminyltransferase [Treponema sp.]
MAKTTFVFAGGGTGGHIYPGLAVADELRTLAKEHNEEISIVWLGNSGGMDRELVEKSGSVDLFYGIPSGKLRRNISLKNFFDLFKIAAGVFVSLFRLMRIKPAVLFSKGGFVSVTPCMAARILGIPVYTHECDFTPGLATKINSRFASKILVSYEATKNYLPAAKRANAVVTGNPVRPVFYASDAENGRRFVFGETRLEKPVLLVMGGSLGAHQINQLVQENLDWLCEHFEVVHQTGRADEAMTKIQHEGYHPYAFIYKEMCDVISAADVVVSRAGANAIWECAVLAKPMVLIPLCGSGTRGDQVDNAKYFVEQSAALMLLGEEADGVHVRDALTKMENAEYRATCSEACKKMTAGKRPALEIAKIIYDGVKK